ncbi:hypothetical protein C9374_013006 [Naegleria lovaniensis]|uniref:Uncharacterized protein n=1 Tax=Naegleria lovaniensis TaxID=51637 RepID=A0AA88GF97_NAELO|nr:uncharacterized protein C9374_013006 [Naegleria lovaniensis]KAG2372976.1 hypothetical protein C9374_013006 [Naegleria lovaniensis]
MYTLEQIIQLLLSLANTSIQHSHVSENLISHSPSHSTDVSSSTETSLPTTPLSNESGCGIHQPETPTTTCQESISESSSSRAVTTPSTLKQQTSSGKKISSRYTKLRKQLRNCDHFQENYFVFNSFDEPEENNTRHSNPSRTLKRTKEDSSSGPTRNRKHRKKDLVNTNPPKHCLPLDDDPYTSPQQPQQQFEQQQHNDVNELIVHEWIPVDPSTCTAMPQHLPLVIGNHQQISSQVHETQILNENIQQVFSTLFDSTHPDFERQFQQVFQAWLMVKQVLAMHYNHSNHFNSVPQPNMDNIVFSDPTVDTNCYEQDKDMSFLFANNSNK